MFQLNIGKIVKLLRNPNFPMWSRNLLKITKILTKSWLHNILLRNIIQNLGLIVSMSGTSFIKQKLGLRVSVYFWFYQGIINRTVVAGLFYKHIRHWLINLFIHSVILCENIFKTLSLPSRNSQGAETLKECSPPLCHMSYVMCHMSHVMYHV